MLKGIEEESPWKIQTIRMQEIHCIFDATPIVPNIAFAGPCVFYGTVLNDCCYTSQFKHVFRMEENLSRVLDQNSLTL